MLVLSRKQGEMIDYRFGPEFLEELRDAVDRGCELTMRIIVVDIDRGKIRLGSEASQAITITRPDDKFRNHVAPPLQPVPS